MRWNRRGLWELRRPLACPSSKRQLLLLIVLCLIGVCIFQKTLNGTSKKPKTKKPKPSNEFNFTVKVKNFNEVNFTVKVKNFNEFNFTVKVKNFNEFNFTVKVENLNEFHINGRKEGWCTDAPRLDPFHETLKPLIKMPSRPQCITPEFPLLFNGTLNATVVPVMSPSGYRNLSILSCCYKLMKKEWRTSVVCRDNSDDEYDFSKTCYPLSLERETVIPKDHEFIFIYCRFNLTIRKLNERKYVREPLSQSSSGGALPKIGEPNITNGEQIVDAMAFVHMKPEVLRRRDPTLKSGDKLNVFILILDSMTHSNFIRTFSKSHDFLVNNMSALQMNWFNEIRNLTYENLSPMFIGKSGQEATVSCVLPEMNEVCRMIWDHYSERGYATFYHEEWRDIPHILYKVKQKLGIHPPNPTDYYFHLFIRQAQRLLGRDLRYLGWMCIGPRLTFQLMLHNSVQFIQKMQAHEKNYFGIVFPAGFSHDDINESFWADPTLLDFLKWLKVHLTNNTIFIVMGDHGQKFGPIAKHRLGKIENLLPALYFVLPPTLQAKYGRAYKNLIGNQNRLTTAFDLHETLIDVAASQDKLRDLVIRRREERLKREAVMPRGVSLFLPVPLERSCTQAGILPHFCACNRMVPIQMSFNSVNLAANYALDHINKLIRAEQRCAPLRLDKVVSAWKTVPAPNATWEGYEINFRTLPGDASFQALVTRAYFSDTWQVSGTVERTNTFGKWS